MGLSQQSAWPSTRASLRRCGVAAQDASWLKASLRGLGPRPRRPVVAP